MKSIASYLSLSGLARHSRALHKTQDVEQAGLTPLGSIGWFKQAAASTQPTAGYSHVWDTYRDFAEQLRTAAPEARVIVITSASPEEGKSTTAANLATCLARDGHRVVLIDANLRWPSLRTPNRDDASFGLAELVLNASLEAQHALVRTSERGLFLLPSGDAPSTAGDLLQSPRLREVFASLRDAMDYVIADAPPVLENEDATLLAKAADATVLVVEAGKTRQRPLKRALDTLAAASVRPAGAVLNRAAVSAVQAMPSTTLAPEPAPVVPFESALAEAFATAAPREVEALPPPNFEADEAVSDIQPEAPKLRLIQPYERPLLPFGEQDAPREDTTITPTTTPYKDPLEITVEELLVDLEETLSLIRTLRRKHASGEVV